MTIRNLEAVFKPKSIALIGASDKPGSIGAILAENLLAAGFKGEVMPVNPKYGKIRGLKTYPDVASLPQAVDLGSDLHARGRRTRNHRRARSTRRTGRGGNHGGIRGTSRSTRHRAPKSAHERSKAGQVRIVGPNCLGILVPGIGLNASFAHRAAKGGAPGLCGPVGRHRDIGAGLGRRARHRFFPSGLPRRHGRCRFRRHAGLPGQ